MTSSTALSEAITRWLQPSATPWRSQDKSTFSAKVRNRRHVKEQSLKDSQTWGWIPNKHRHHDHVTIPTASSVWSCLTALAALVGLALIVDAEPGQLGDL